MADNGRWFKVWTSVFSDPDMDNMTVQNFGRWALMGAYIKAHGTDGKISLDAPSKTLVKRLEFDTFEQMCECFIGMKNVEIEIHKNETDVIVSLNLRYMNWLKYQGDFSTARVQKHRAKNVSHETDKEEKRREEKRREKEEKNIGTPAKRFVPPTLDEVREHCKKRNNTVSPEKFHAFYEAKGWMVGKNKMKDWKQAVITWEQNSMEGSRPAQDSGPKQPDQLEIMKRGMGKA